MASERTPLLPVVNIPHGHLPELHHTDSLVQRFISLPVLAFKHHWCGIMTTVVSAVACWWFGFAEISVIDDLIFKSIFIIFGFTMGFRNVRANQRYFDAMQQAQNFFHAFWAIYTVMPLESRLRLRGMLTDTMQDACCFIHRVGKHRLHAWYGMVGLEPLKLEERPDDFACPSGAPPRQAPRTFSMSWEASADGTAGKWVHGPREDKHGTESDSEAVDAGSAVDGARASLSPHSQLLQALLEVESELERIEGAPGHQKLRRNFWLFKAQLMKSYDTLLSLAFPSVTDRFLTFVDMCLSFFAISFPWGIKVQTLHFDAIGGKLYRLHIDAGLVLVIYTTLVVIVLFMLNTITAMNEDPLAGHSDDIDLRRLAHSVAYGFEAFDKGESVPSYAAIGPAAEPPPAPAAPAQTS